MSIAPRRRLIRPELPSTNVHASSDRQIQQLRSRLEKERAALARWVIRLKRAFHAFEKAQRTVARLERKINDLEE